MFVARPIGLLGCHQCHLLQVLHLVPAFNIWEEDMLVLFLDVINESVMGSIWCWTEAWSIQDYSSYVVSWWCWGFVCYFSSFSGSARSVNRAETSVWGSQLMRPTPYRARPYGIVSRSASHAICFQHNIIYQPLNRCPSVCLSVCHTFLTMFPLSDYYDILTHCSLW